jgi:hypothetical protein
MLECGRWYEDGRPRGKLDDKFHIPQDEVAPKLWVEAAKRRDSAPPVCEVRRVTMRIGDCSWPQIEGRRRPNTVVKISTGKTWH